MIEDRYWTNPTGNVSKKYREVVIMPIKSDSQ